MLKRAAIFSCILWFGSACISGRDRLEEDEEEENASKPEMQQEVPSENPQQAPEMSQLPPSVSNGLWQQIFTAASIGPEIKSIEFNDRYWNIKPALLNYGADGEFTISGRISHHIPFGFDDQLDYRFSFKGGMIVNSEVNIQEGGWTPIAKPIIEIISNYSQVPLLTEKILELVKLIEDRVMDDSWESDGQKLAASISLRLYENEMKKK